MRDIGQHTAIKIVLLHLYIYIIYQQLNILAFYSSSIFFLFVVFARTMVSLQQKANNHFLCVPHSMGQDPQMEK